MARILVVSSNPVDREVRALVIEFGGFSCATAGSLEEAVNLLQKAYFDLVVTDLKLGAAPEHIVKTLKGVSPEVVVLALADGAETAASADAVVMVPCPPLDLVQHITQTLAKTARARVKTIREKRRFPRYSIGLSCLVRAMRGPRTLVEHGIRALTRNISRGGLCFVGAAEWKVGMELECVIELPGGVFGDRPTAISSQGKVVWFNAQEREGSAVAASIERFEFVDLGK
ncbi:MAG: PilZ domain-containing protein [Acidobacteria bacterium]|nr:PilZ domain-containing protein [Acidobacteriota bacterium]